jgi:predicted RNA-binding protein with TRAM domain
VKIDDVGREGDGIARVEGFVVFVPNTKKGDSVKIQITKVSRRVGFGEVVTE